MNDLLPVTQADREAVQTFHRTMAKRLMSDIASDRPRLGEDEGDAGTLVQAFASHRLTALSQQESRAAGEVCLDRADLEEVRRSLAILQMEAEGNLPWLPGWLLDTKASLEVLTNALYPTPEGEKA